MAKYTVQKGDTLSAIGKKYGVSYQDIAEQNGIKNPDLIYAGQTLTINTPEQKPAATTPTVAPTTPTATPKETPKETPSNANASADIKLVEPTTNTPAAGNQPFVYENFAYESYDPMSDPLIQQAYDLIAQHSGTKPGEWVDPYKDTYMGYLNQYENRDPFSYDFNSDALYNQYKDQYIQQGRLAMMDTMGQAAAMTGGYGNSYAQTVGQQAYNQQLNQLNEIMPELYGMAYDRYTQEGQDLLNMYNAYLGLSEKEYGEYQAGVDNWYREMDRLTSDYDTLYNRGWDEYVLGYNTAYDDYSTGRSEAFSNYQNSINQAFTSSENEKDRLHQSEENEKSRTFTSTENDKDRNLTITENDKDRATAEKKANYDNVVEYIEKTGQIPSPDKLKEAGITQKEAKALKDAHDAASTGASGVKLDNVASMSSYDLVSYMSSYQKKGDNNGLAAFLDDCVLTGRLAQGQADEYYAQYRTEEQVEPVDTTVDPIEDEKPKTQGNHGGSAGVWYWEQK